VRGGKKALCYEEPLRNYVLRDPVPSGGASQEEENQPEENSGKKIKRGVAKSTKIQRNLEVHQQRGWKPDNPEEKKNPNRKEKKTGGKVGQEDTPHGGP